MTRFLSEPAILVQNSSLLQHNSKPACLLRNNLPFYIRTNFALQIAPPQKKTFKAVEKFIKLKLSNSIFIDASKAITFNYLIYDVGLVGAFVVLQKKVFFCFWIFLFCFLLFVDKMKILIFQRHATFVAKHSDGLEHESIKLSRLSNETKYARIINN